MAPIHDQLSLVQLAYLVALDRHRHFARAAKHCQVTQPTLSMQIQRLEEKLGAPLFDRTKRPVEPTDLGRQVIDQARTVLDEAALIRELVDASRTALQGELHIGMISTLAPYLLPLFLQRFRQRYDQIQLSIEELTTDEITEKLHHGTLDAALVATSETLRHTTERPLFEEPFVGYISKHHALASHDSIHPNDLHSADLWLLKEGHCLRDQTLQVCRSLSEEPPGADRPFSFETGSLETLKKLVERSGGFTLLPHLATLNLEEEKRQLIRPFDPPSPSRQIRLLHRKTYLKKNLIEVFVNEVLHALPPAIETAATPPIDLAPTEV